MIKEIEKLKKIKGIESAILFGSSLNKKDPEDIDLCIFTSKPLTLSQKLRIINKLSEKHDISFYEDLPVHIRKEVFSKGKILFTNNYYRLLELMKINDLSYIKYKHFLQDYHDSVMVRT